MANNQSVRRHLDAFTRGRIIGKLEEARSVTSVAAEFGIACSIVSRLWRQFQTTGTAVREFSSGRPRGTTPADDRRLHAGGLFARCPVRCVPLTPAHRRRRFLWCREHRNWRDKEWGRVLFTDESRFSLVAILIAYSSGESVEAAIIPRTSLKGTGMEVAVFSFGEASCLRRYGLQFLFMDDNAPCHRTVAAEQLLESEDIERMGLVGTISGSQSHRACMGFSRQTLGSSYLTTSNDSGASIGAASRMGSNASITH
ncbi:transposable element Tc1 transposase [Trichonephila clavipes]|nr:transposable element Tc1 transposase [Trichonephila clavipes]